VSENPRFVTQLEPVHQARQFLDDGGLNFQKLSKRQLVHGRVRTHGPLLVTATQCSK
jgi:hypothetical protein